jgi:hypothetical protein
MKIYVYLLLLMLYGCAASSLDQISREESELKSVLIDVFNEENRNANKIDVKKISAYDWHYESMTRDVMREKSASRIIPLLNMLYDKSKSCSDYTKKVQQVAMDSGVSMGLMFALSNQGKCGPFEFVRRVNEDLNSDYRYSNQIVQQREMNN